MEEDGVLEDNVVREGPSEEGTQPARSSARCG